MAPGFQDVLYSFIQTVSYKRCSLAVIFYFLFQDACICLRNVLPTWSINRSCIIQSRLQRCGRFIVFNRQIYLSSGTTAMFFSGQKLSISECFFFFNELFKKTFLVQYVFSVWIPFYFKTSNVLRFQVWVCKNNKHIPNLTFDLRWRKIPSFDVKWNPLPSGGT